MNTSPGFIDTLFSKTSRLTLLIVVCAALCFVFGFLGWWAQRAALELSFSDVLYRAITGISLATSIDKSADWQGDWRLEISRWSAVLMIIAAASKTLVYLLGDHWRRKRAESQRNHWIVVGNSPLANQLSSAATRQKHHVNRLLCASSTGQHPSKSVFIDARQWSIENAVALGLHHASGTVVATDDDNTSLNIALEIRHTLPVDSDQIIMACLESTWLTLRIDELHGQNDIAIFSEAQSAVRRLQKRFPPFLLAARFQHKRIHTVIVNFSAYGEAVLIETLLSSLTVDLQKPLFSIIDPNADTVKNTLTMRYPELHLSAHIKYVNGQLDGKSGIPDKAAIENVLSIAPVTAVYCCAPDNNKAMQTAIISQALALKTPRCNAAIFCRQETSPASKQNSTSLKQYSPADIVTFGTVAELTEDTGLFNHTVDDFARAFHLAYQQKATPDKPANTNWEDLPADKRDANRRIVVHIPAKLHSMGIDIAQWLATDDDLTEVFSQGKPERIDADASLIERLARLEHERWMADRRINGWTYGEDRDDLRRIHPDLKPYDDLDESSKIYDREIVTSLFKLFAD